MPWGNRGIYRDPKPGDRVSPKLGNGIGTLLHTFTTKAGPRWRVEWDNGPTTTEAAYDLQPREEEA